MQISLVQSILIGIVYYLSFTGTPWLTALGSTMLHCPIISGLIVGCILGKPREGAILGAAIQLPFIAFISAGGAQAMDPGIAGTLGTALAIASNVDGATAIAIATPISMLGTILWVIHMTVDVALVTKCDEAADEGNMRKLCFWHIVPPSIVTFFLCVIPVAAGCYLGSSVVSNIIGALQGRPIVVLQVIGGLLPAVGIAMNLRALNRPGTILWFVLGFVISTYLGIGTLPLAIIAGIGAFFIATAEDKMEERPQLAVASHGSTDPDVASDNPDDDFE